MTLFNKRPKLTRQQEAATDIAVEEMGTAVQRLKLSFRDVKRSQIDDIDINPITMDWKKLEKQLSPDTGLMALCFSLVSTLEATDITAAKSFHNDKATPLMIKIAVAAQHILDYNSKRAAS